jgi:hypothetical protein
MSTIFYSAVPLTHAGIARLTHLEMEITYNKMNSPNSKLL